MSFLIEKHKIQIKPKKINHSVFNSLTTAFICSTGTYDSPCIWKTMQNRKIGIEASLENNWNMQIDICSVDNLSNFILPYSTIVDMIRAFLTFAFFTSYWESV